MKRLIDINSIRGFHLLDSQSGGFRSFDLIGQPTQEQAAGSQINSGDRQLYPNVQPRKCWIHHPRASRLNPAREVLDGMEGGMWRLAAGFAAQLFPNP